MFFDIVAQGRFQPTRSTIDHFYRTFFVATIVSWGRVSPGDLFLYFSTEPRCGFSISIIPRCRAVRILVFENRTARYGAVRILVLDFHTLRCGAVRCGAFFFKAKSYGTVRLGKTAPKRTAP